MTEFGLSCPVMRPSGERVLLAHGGGGRLMHQLIAGLFLEEFGSPPLAAQHDGALLHLGGQRLAFTTDSYVVRPLEFPGGDIGSLAVYGTVNDLAMCGARPLYLSAGFILEEGLEMETLRRLVRSMRDAAARTGIALVTGDTKVVDKGKGDGIFINTAGIGVVEAPADIGPAAVRPGDAVIVSGDLGSHGVAVLSVREGLEFASPVLSDLAPLWEPVAALLGAGIEIHCLRDLTRGGLASALNEIAAAGVGIQIREAAVPVAEAVQGACEILGLDPLYVANEGRFVAFVPEHDAVRALGVLRKLPVSAAAVRIGTATQGPPGSVSVESRIGGRRVLDLLSGEQLPRIC
jgi:hydrogenase expression/formation protein HypE